MSDSPDQPARPSRLRRWLQFSLRTALWLTVVCAVVFGWLSDRQRLKEQLANERLEKEALRIARDASNVEQQLQLWRPAVPTETDESTVQPLRQHLANPRFAIGNAPLQLSNTQLLSSALVQSRVSSTAFVPWIVDDTGDARIAFPGGSGTWLLGTPRFATPKQGSVDELLKLLEAADAKTRAQAACTLATIGANARQARDALIRCLKDQDHDVRWHAAYALGRIGPPVGSKKDKGPPVNKAAEALRAEMNDENSTLPAFAAQMLRRADPNAAIGSRLVQLLEHSQAKTRRRAAEQLALSGGAALNQVPVGPPVPGVGLPPKLLDQARRGILKLLSDPDRGVRQAAMTGVAALCPAQQAHAALQRAFKNEQDQELQVHAATLWNHIDRRLRMRAQD